MNHGDIKPENILLTSYNQVFLTDLVRYKPTYLPIDDLQWYKNYFGELDNTNRCYIAPERFVQRNVYDEWKRGTKNLPEDIKHKQKMDIFSAGCVIAEILLDRGCLFDLARLKQYRRHEEVKQEVDGKNVEEEIGNIIKKIGDEDIQELIKQMIKPDPANRPQINECI